MRCGGFGACCASPRRRANHVRRAAPRSDDARRARRGRGGDLTPTEFRVLAALAERRGAVLPRRELVRAAWPPGAEVSDNSIDQYIVRVRGKLRPGTSGTAIVTSRGVGYRL